MSKSTARQPSRLDHAKCHEGGIRCPRPSGKLPAKPASARTPSASTSSNGLIAAERTPGNQRRFDPDTACRIKAARVAQRIGLTVAEVRAMLDTLPPAPTVNDWHRLEDTLAAEAERRIAELRAVLADIRSDQKLCAL